MFGKSASRHSSALPQVYLSLLEGADNGAAEELFLNLLRTESANSLTTRAGSAWSKSSPVLPLYYPLLHRQLSER